MKIVVLEPIHAEAMRLLRGEAEVVAWDDPAKHDWSDADAVIVRAASVTREQIAAARTEGYREAWDRRQRH